MLRVCISLGIYYPEFSRTFRRLRPLDIRTFALSGFFFFGVFRSSIRSNLLLDILIFFSLEFTRLRLFISTPFAQIFMGPRMLRYSEEVPGHSGVSEGNGERGCVDSLPVMRIYPFRRQVIQFARWMRKYLKHFRWRCFPLDFPARVYGFDDVLRQKFCRDQNYPPATSVARVYNARNLFVHVYV